MTSQANAYFANKLKERELDEVKVPEVRLKQRSLEEVDKPKVMISNLEYQERARSNRANEDLKAQELAEQERYHNLTHDIDFATKLTRQEQLNKSQAETLGRIYSKGTLQNGYGILPAEAFSQHATGLYTSKDGSTKDDSNYAISGGAAPIDESAPQPNSIIGRSVSGWKTAFDSVKPKTKAKEAVEKYMIRDSLNYMPFQYGSDNELMFLGRKVG